MQPPDVTPPLAIEKVEAFVLRAPVPFPVRTSFGIMHDRPAVLVRVTDRDGATGWGEVWCNFPSVGAEHRARLVASCLAPALRGRAWPGPRECFETLTRQMRILAIQSGEPGPLAQAIAGVDIALWDLAARRLGQPLWRLFGGGGDTVAVYASGINPDDPVRVAEAKAREGYAAFKLKIGFGDARDEDNVRALRAAMGDSAALMADANQAWEPGQAADMAERLAPYGLLWLEEPVPADTSLEDWHALAARSPIRLAAGENLREAAAFRAAVDRGGLAVVQPDLGKWGGFSGCLPVGRYVMDRGRWFCPHWLGGGVGLVASLHLKAALGGPGYVEVDSNPNPLRERLAEPAFDLRDGRVRLPERPGLGIEPDPAALSEYLVAVQDG